MFGKLGRPVKVDWVACLLGALGVSSSSSSLLISMTWAALFPLPAGAVVEAADCSLDELGGVLVAEPGRCVHSLFTAAIRGMSFISTSSSSSPLLVRSPLRFGDTRVSEG